MLCERCTIVCVFASKELISLCIGNIVISLGHLNLRSALNIGHMCL